MEEAYQEKEKLLKYIEDDTINPRTWEKWNEGITEKEKKAILNKLVIKDTINPGTWRPWEDWITEEQREECYVSYIGRINPKTLKPYEEWLSDPWKKWITSKQKRIIRENLAQKQINFYRNLFEKLLRRDPTESLTLVFTNSIISKFYELPSFCWEGSRSEYGRLKNEITKLIWEYSERLKEKNVYIKNVTLGVVDTPMFKKRGKKSEIKSIERSFRFLQVQNNFAKKSLIL